MPSKKEELAEALVEGVGIELTDLAGRPFTFLAANLDPTDVVVTVDTTHRFPAVGFVKVGAERIPYGAKTATTLQATSRDPNAIPYRTGKHVYEDSGTFSLVDSARRQLVYETAEGKYLRALLTNHGLPLIAAFSDAQRRAFGIVASYPAAGPRKTIVKGLDAVLSGQLRTAAIVAGQLELIDASTWPAFTNRLVRILPPSPQAGLYRLGAIVAPAVAKLDPAVGTYTDSGAGLVDETPIAIELVPWDVWEDPWEHNIFHVDLLKFGAQALVKGAAYLQGGEEAISTDATHVDVLADINQVLGVWLATDTLRTGTNYFLPGGAFLNKTITLGSALPGVQTAVIVDYGSISYTAQALPGIATDGKDYFPFYLTDPAAGLTSMFEVLRAAGYLPKFNPITV